MWIMWICGSNNCLEEVSAESFIVPYSRNAKSGLEPVIEHLVGRQGQPRGRSKTMLSKALSIIRCSLHSDVFYRYSDTGPYTIASFYFPSSLWTTCLKD